MLKRFVLSAAVVCAASFSLGEHAFAQVVIQPLFYSPQNWIIPPHVGGDREFDGNGPRVWLNVRLYIKPQALSEVWAEVEMGALETKKDWTQARGVQHVRVATFARPLTCIITRDRLPFAFSYIDTNHDVDTFNNPCACGLLNSVRFVGDTKGDEAGTRTGVLLEFNPILAR